MIVALAVSACVTSAGRETALPDLKGRNVSTIVARLGPSDFQEPVDGRTAYSWTVETRAPATPVRTTRVSYAAGVPNNIETMAYPDPPRVATCALRALVDGAGIVTATDWQGSKAGCADAARKLAGQQ